VIVRGDGVAAYCCAHLLAKAGFQIELQPVDRARLPMIVLGDRALALVRDIFDRPALLADAPRIRKRVVAWGPDAKALPLDHSAILVSETELLEAIRPAASQGALDAAFSVYAARPLPDPVTEHAFGTHRAYAIPVTLQPASDPETCWIESVPDGWLFLTANWLLAAGAEPTALLSASRLVAPRIASYGAAQGPFPAHPRIMSPLGGPGWLACGTAAMAFDPICGDGTAHAIREAILASAVIRALTKGGDAAGLLAHYEARLIAGFRRHLDLCSEFYGSGGRSPFWQSAVSAIASGLEWCDARLAAHAGFRYQLRGFELEAVC
jgi:hypothetical protein